MTAIPSIAFHDIDAPQLDDEMDVASSPCRQPDDIDIDLDSIRDPSVIGSVHDEMIDDFAQPASPGHENMEDLFDENLPDDDMVDDAKQDFSAEQHDTDYNMDTFHEEVHPDEDEDILYEDEEDARPVFHQDEDTAEYHNDQEPQEQQDADADAEVILEEFADRPEPEQQVSLVTNESESLPFEDAIAAVEEIAYSPEQSRILGTDAPDNTQEYSGDQTEEQAHAREQTERHDEISEYLVQHDENEPGDNTFEHGYGTHAEDEATTEANLSAAQTTAEEHEDQAHEAIAESHEGDSANQTVHPVTLVYLDQEMSLFPPMIGDTSSMYYLSDSSPAFAPLTKLLGACREVLTGTLDDDDELVIDVPGLGLHICEDSKHAAQITLAEVLDVYLHLCHNDEGHQVQPLYCYLSSRVSLASQYAYLASASTEGKTYTEIATLHMGSASPEGEDADAADYDQEQQDSGESSMPRSDQAIEESTDQQPPTIHAASEPHAEASSSEVSELNNTTIPSVSEDTANASAPAADNVSSAETGQIEILASTNEPEQFCLDEEELPQDDDQDYVYDETHEAGGNGGEQQQSEVTIQPVSQARQSTQCGRRPSRCSSARRCSPKSLAQKTPVLTSTMSKATTDFEPEEVILEQSGHEPFEEDLFSTHDKDGKKSDHDASAETSAEDHSALQNEQDMAQNGALVMTNEDSSSKDKPLSTSPDNAQIAGNPSPPMTPLQGKTVKRKVDDDDEFLFLGLGHSGPEATTAFVSFLVKYPPSTLLLSTDAGIAPKLATHQQQDLDDRGRLFSPGLTNHDRT